MLSIQTTGEQQDCTTGEQRGDPRQTWKKLSAEKCFCNNSCDCCTLHCCGLSISIIWIIIGVIGALVSQGVLASLQNESYETAACCLTTAPYDCYDECCMSYRVDLHYPNITCEELETVYLVYLVDGLLQCFAGICGVIGICAFVALMLLVPLFYSFASIVITVVVIAILKMYLGVLSLAISALIIYLFYMNWKIMRDAQSGYQNQPDA